MKIEEGCNECGRSFSDHKSDPDVPCPVENNAGREHKMPNGTILVLEWIGGKQGWKWMEKK